METNIILFIILGIVITCLIAVVFGIYHVHRNTINGLLEHGFKTDREIKQLEDLLLTHIGATRNLSEIITKMYELSKLKLEKKELIKRLNAIKDQQEEVNDELNPD